MTVIGVLALQGDFAEHFAMVRRLGAEAREVRVPKDLEGLAGLILPGGESTAIYRLMERWGLVEPLVALAHSGTPIWGTCAGLILICRSVLGDSVPSLNLLDVDIQRNAYGRQVDSFEADVRIPVLGESPLRAMFIRAPLIKHVGPGVDVLARLADQSPVAVRQRNILGSTFHPELTADGRFHSYLLRLAEEHAKSTNAAAM